MSIESRFRTGVLAYAPVSALIGNRFYRNQLPQEPPQFPLARYQRISTVPIYTQALAGNNSLPPKWVRFQIDILAAGKVTGTQSGEQTDAIANAIVASLQTFNLSAEPESPAVLRQAPNYLLAQRSFLEPNTQPPLFCLRLDVKCFCTES